MLCNGDAGRRRGWRAAVVAALIGLLAACGGDGGADATPLPSSLQLTAPAGAQPLGAPVAFSSNASGTFTYQWTFGDGSSSTEAAPSHAFARAGVYTVNLALLNADGATATATVVVAIADRAIVQGKACTGAAESGWCWQQPLPQGNAIRAYHYLDASTGYAVGVHGQIMKTTDGGVTWQAQVSGTTTELLSVAFANAQVGWVGGTLGEVLKTIDGGSSWERTSLGLNEFAAAVGAVDENRAWVVGGYGSIYATRDGGRAWKQLRPPEFPYRVAALSDTEVWVLPYSFAATSPRAWHTVDGGATWNPVELPTASAGFYVDPFDLQFVDASHGFYARIESGYDGAGNYVSRRQAFLTTDGGRTWQPMPVPVGDAYGGRYQLAAPGVVYWLQPYASSVFKTDSGATWQPITLPSEIAAAFDPRLRAFDANRILLTDYYGTLAYLSVDGGATWSSRKAGGPGTGFALNSVWFFDSREGLAWGDDGSSARTIDGGQTWTTTAAASVGYGWRRGQFLADGSVGWIISDAGAVYRSTDKGRSWFAPAPQIATPLYGLTDLHFVDALHGWAVSPYASVSSGIWASSDGGVTWQPTTLPAFSTGYTSVRFADASHGVAVGPPGVALVTADGGVTWAARPTGAPMLTRVAFADADTVVAVGESGAIVRSADRGQTWSVVEESGANRLLDVRFVSASVGHAVGDQGTVLLTRDGGLTWARQEPATTQFLSAVFFLDEMTGWTAGQGGTILATATGGR